MQPKPQPTRQEIEPIPPTAVTLLNPVVVLVETGESMGYLVARNSEAATTPDLLRLQGAVYVRFPLLNTETPQLREVLLSRDEQGLYIARIPGTEVIFRHPSELPYVIQSIRSSEYQEFAFLIQREETAALVAWLGQRFHAVPGFQLEPNFRLQTPPRYANRLQPHPRFSFFV